MPRQNRIQRNRNRTGQANLASVGVAAEEQFEISVRRLAVDFRSMRKQDGKFVVRNIGRGILNIVGPVVMGVINAGQVDTLTVTDDHLGFVQQHPYSHFFQSRDHADRVVIAQHAINGFLRWERTSAKPSRAASKGRTFFPGSRP